MGNQNIESVLELDSEYLLLIGYPHLFSVPKIGFKNEFHIISLVSLKIKRQSCNE